MAQVMHVELWITLLKQRCPHNNWGIFVFTSRSHEVSSSNIKYLTKEGTYIEVKASSACGISSCIGVPYLVNLTSVG